MILGLKARWDSLVSDDISKLSDVVELHLELSDINELFDKQVNALSSLNKVFHLHAPFKNAKGAYVDFLNDFDVFSKCVKLGDTLNKGAYHLVTHCSCGSEADFSVILANLKKLLKKSGKVIFCFENLTSEGSNWFKRVSDFSRLFNSVDNKRVGMCLDVCHAFYESKRVFGDFIKSIGDKIFHVHLADLGLNHEHGVMIGDGVIDFNSVFSKLSKLNGVTLIPEVANSHLNKSAGLVTAFNRLSDYL
ncbi:MAG TPA: TIM barrel protein [Candidatus Nanoarchaeia archaeon]|nr:TIM barrel protein [Candidatus Nanoarchaeia archaeon]